MPRNAGRLIVLPFVLLACAAVTFAYLRFNPIQAYQGNSPDVGNPPFRAHGPLRARQIARPPSSSSDSSSTENVDAPSHTASSFTADTLSPDEVGKVLDIIARSQPESDSPSDQDSTQLLHSLYEAALLVARSEMLSDIAPDLSRMDAQPEPQRRRRSSRVASNSASYQTLAPSVNRLIARRSVYMASTPSTGTPPMSTTTSLPPTPTPSDAVNQVVNNFWAANTLWENKGAVAGILVVTALVAFGIFEVAILLVRKYIRERREPPELKERRVNRESLFGSDVSMDDDKVDILKPLPNAYLGPETVVTVPQVARNSYTDFKQDIDSERDESIDESPQSLAYNTPFGTPPTLWHDQYMEIDLGDTQKPLNQDVPTSPSTLYMSEINPHLDGRAAALQRLNGIMDKTPIEPKFDLVRGRDDYDRAVGRD